MNYAASAPLRGARLVVTRPVDGRGALVEAIEELGGEAICLSAVEIGPPEDREPLRRAIEAWAGFDWVVFTSARAVDAVEREGANLGASPPRLAAVGPATAARVEKAGGQVDLVPEDHRGEELARALVGAMERPERKRVLLPRSDLGRGELPAILTRAGVDVSDVVAYRTIPWAVGLNELEALGEVDAFLLASPSAVEGLLARAGAGGFRRIFPRAIVAAIGTTTAEALGAAGLAPDVVPARSTADGLVRAVVERIATG